MPRERLDAGWPGLAADHRTDRDPAAHRHRQRTRLRPLRAACCEENGGFSACSGSNSGLPVQMHGLGDGQGHHAQGRAGDRAARGACCHSPSGRRSRRRRMWLDLSAIEMAALEQEQLRVVLLDTRNRIIETPMIYQGSANEASVRIGELFREAVRLNAVSIILMHNHPSGDPTPSSADISLTVEVVAAGQVARHRGRRPPGVRTRAARFAEAAWPRFPARLTRAHATFRRHG